MLRPMRGLGLVGSLVLAASLLTANARATADTLLGAGPRSVSLAQADVANAQPVAAAYVNPAQAWAPGVRMAVGYSHGVTSLKLNDKSAGLGDIAGTHFQLQIGRKMLDDAALGAAIHAYLPNRSLARIEFVSGVEPRFVRIEPGAYRATGLVVMAARWSYVSFGLGLSMLARAQGDVDFTMGQDGSGVFADGAANVETPYEATLVAGVSFDFDDASVALRYRGEQSFNMRMVTRVVVDVQGNPLNGVTEVGLHGASGYVPSMWDVAASWRFGQSLRAMTSLQLARWKQAPSPAIDLHMNINLGMSPGIREVRFARPALRDTLSPRIGFEWFPSGPEQPWVVRVGYAWNPSPVSIVRGLPTPVDSSYHVMATGAGRDCGNLWGVEFRADAALQLVRFASRSIDKRHDLMPFAKYRSSGSILVGSIGLQGAWQ